MTYVLKTKEEFETQDFEEKAGMISIYVCQGCAKIVLYSYTASGITPYILTCVDCGSEARHQEDVEQPDRIWYRPDNIQELERLAILALQTGIANGLYKNEDPEELRKQFLDSYVEHYNGGGLFAKLLK